MSVHDLPSKSSPSDRWRAAEERFRSILEGHGWKLRSLPRKSGYEADLLVRKGSVSYVVELKAASEGRSDRLVPIFAHEPTIARSPDSKAMRQSR